MSYAIKPGDTLSRIAAKHKTSVSALMKANPKIQDANFIRAGDSLRIPGKTDGFEGASAKRTSKGRATEDTFVDGATKTDTSSPAKKGGKAGAIKSSDVMKHAKKEAAEINRTGGYRFDGKNDCYGFVRRVWDPILQAKGKSKLPVNDVGSKNWSRIDWDKLKPGAVLSTAKGHAWGANWHGGLYAGKINGVHYIYDNSGSKGAKLRPLPSPDYFKYVHTPTLKMLDGEG
ncbi:LysM peptidoglycan-binding domain-containing protein [Myxococcus sp. K15C18031901]|uniref:LysM peptidoglycan-binding domain-containing protein n=1 Tax=Myxococcus dinghuensis TaxID=2906761 RepID=UPI0020A7D451|nr:LysM peptidoglycan-binding domain-containing protein [Myxococcus dinghuensis]MCP3097866.1 LysM peptidoglycan-binding domain-containing protein [Myxococcus dinghuensis]